MKTEIFIIPVWALCYLINGSVDSLDFGEKEIIDDWCQKNNILDVWTPDDVDSESFFTYYPPFGKACMVVECECVIEW